MDASQYKDYILTLLFVKYVTDKFKGQKYADINVPAGGSFDDLVALKNNKDIGEKMDKAIAKLAEANNLTGVIDNAKFFDNSKFGNGKDMVDTLTGLVSIFERPEFNFSNNKAGGDDILGDAYEYLMRNFATESGKSKGQFYTPAEVSRLIAKVIGISKDELRQISTMTPLRLWLPLLRAAASWWTGVNLNGQESDVSTIGMAKMNMILHGEQTADLRQGDTINDPQHYQIRDTLLQQFNYVVANPPFSQKSWLKSAGSEDKYKRWGNEIGIGVPPEKCGDYAFLLHIIVARSYRHGGSRYSPRRKLFRNAEADIRKYTPVQHHYIKGIIGLPGNLFFGTGIPACIVIDKAHAFESKGIFMINANEG